MLFATSFRSWLGLAVLGAAVFCTALSAHRAPRNALAEEGATGPLTKAGLPFCRPNDDRIPVPTWTAALDENGHLTSEPPTEDGRVVYIELDADAGLIDCAADLDKVFSLPLPDDRANPQNGGLSVNIQGHTQFANGMCHFQGFYMNAEVRGMHQGWVDTKFDAVDRFRLITSGQYCAVK